MQPGLWTLWSPRGVQHPTRAALLTRRQPQQPVPRRRRVVRTTVPPCRHPPTPGAFLPATPSRATLASRATLSRATLASRARTGRDQTRKRPPATGWRAPQALQTGSPTAPGRSPVTPCPPPGCPRNRRRRTPAWAPLPLGIRGCRIPPLAMGRRAAAPPREGSPAAQRPATPGPAGGPQGSGTPRSPPCVLWWPRRRTRGYSPRPPWRSCTAGGRCPWRRG
mmetsp:Transcript_12908/g.32259  ORF Transcript_12908/g.32259 Transcript_12908/m.32259 type:complete len:222 (+) Transcript_12908:1324-1989(+)